MPDSNSTSKRIVKNTAFLYAKMAITMFVSLYTTRLILGSLGVSDFGIFNVVGGAIAMLGFLNSAMASASMRFMAYTEGENNLLKKQQVFNISIVLHFVLAFVVAIILVGAGYFFFNGVLNITQDRMDAAKIVYGSLIVSTMLTVMNVPYDAVMNAHENMLYYSIVGIVESILKLGVAFACVYTIYDKLIVYGVLMACIPLITLTIMKLYCHKNYDECVISPLKFYNKSIVKEMLNFAGWSFMGAASSMGGNYGQLLVVNHYCGVTINTAIGIANQLDGQLHSFSNNMLKALSPVVTKSEGEGDRDKMLRLATTGCKFSFALVAFFSIPIIIEMPFIQTIWLKNVPEWAILFAQLQLIRTLMEQLTVSYSTAISAEGHIASYQSINSIINIVPIFCIFILFYMGCSPVYMYIVNILFFGGVHSAINVVYANRLCGLKYNSFFNHLFFPVVISFLLSFLLASIPLMIFEKGWIRLFLTTLLGFCSYLLAFWFVGMDCFERKVVMAGIRNVCNMIRKKYRL